MHTSSGNLAEEALQLALDAAGAGTWDWNVQTGELVWSKQCLAMFGLPADTRMSYERFMQLVHPDDRERIDRAVKATLDRRSDYSVEMRTVWPDGNVHWVASRGRVLFNDAGQPVRMIGGGLDITKLKQTEEDVRQQRSRYEFVAEGSDVGFWFCDLPFDKVIWDKRVKNHFWLPPDDSPVTMEIFYSQLHPEDREPTRLAIENSINNHEQYDVEYRTIAPDGREKWIRANGRAFYDENGKAASFDGITQDITARKRAEADLRASEARYRTLFETMAEGFVLCELVRDHQGRAIDIRWLECNPALERLTGLSRDQVIGHCASEIFPDEWEWWVRTYARVVEEKRVYRFEHGAESVGRTWDLIAFPYEGDRFAVLYDDITARKQAEEALRASEARHRDLAANLDREVQVRTRELQQRTEQVMRTSDDLRELSGRVLRVQDEERRRIARELHDSAGQILTALGLELGSLSEDVEKVAPQLAGSCAKAQELVQQLHREIRTTSYLLHPPLLDDAGLSSALNWYVEGLSQRSGIEIHLDIPDDLGRLPRDMELVMFRLVQESLTNIHRHSGSRTAEIRIAREDGIVTIEVQDQGRGMSSEELKKIREGGSGVGIRGMSERLRQFHGELKIESDESGTEVGVRIPIPQRAAQFTEPLQPAV